MSIYLDLVSAKIDIDNHESDLYCKDTSVSRAILLKYGYIPASLKFRSNLDGQSWFDIPFAYDPFWEGKRR